MDSAMDPYHENGFQGLVRFDQVWYFHLLSLFMVIAAFVLFVLS